MRPTGSYVEYQLQGADRASGEGDREAVRHRPASRGVEARHERHGPQLAAAAGDQQGHARRLRFDDGGDDLPRRRERPPWHARGGEVLRRPRGGDGVQAGAGDQPTRGGAREAPAHLRRRAMLSDLPPLLPPVLWIGAAPSSARPTCGSPRAGSTWTSSTTSTDPLESLAEGLYARRPRARSTACCSRTAP